MKFMRRLTVCYVEQLFVIFSDEICYEWTNFIKWIPEKKIKFSLPELYTIAKSDSMSMTIPNHLNMCTLYFQHLAVHRRSWHENVNKFIFNDFFLLFHLFFLISSCSNTNACVTVQCQILSTHLHVTCIQ